MIIRLEPKNNLSREENSHKIPNQTFCLIQEKISFQTSDVFKSFIVVE
jgi:hypothetical protein